MLDIGTLLQLSQGPAEKYTGGNAGSKTIKNPVLTISDLQFALFSDILITTLIAFVSGTLILWGKNSAANVAELFFLIF